MYIIFLMHIPLKYNSRPRPNRQNISTGSIKGINLFNPPELLNGNQYAQIIDNYIQKINGELEKRKGYTLIYDDETDSPRTMFLNFKDYIYVYAHTNVLAYYNIISDSETIVKNNFTTSDIFEGVVYGDFVYVCNGGDKIGVFSPLYQFLNYDAESSPFNIGATLTGGTSGSTGVIKYINDSGSTGILCIETTDVFQNNETITDNGSAPGSATANGANYVYMEIEQAPKAKKLFVYDGRLIAGNISNSSSLILSSVKDIEYNSIPFLDWNISTSVNGGFDYIKRNYGELRNLTDFNGKIIAGYEKGKASFSPLVQNEDSIGLVQVIKTYFERSDFGMYRSSVTTPYGFIYTNSAGVWNLIYTGNEFDNKLGDQEKDTSRIFGEDFIQDIDFSDSDIVYDDNENILYITCKKNSVRNNIILWYSFDTGGYGTITGWQISRFVKSNKILYGVSSLDGKMYRLFNGYDDNGYKILSSFKQEINIKTLNILYKLLKTELKGFFSKDSDIKIYFDVYDGKMKKNTFGPYYIDVLNSNLSNNIGFNSGGLNSGFGGVNSNSFNIETYINGHTYINEFMRISVRIESYDMLPHKFTWFNIHYEQKGVNRYYANFNL